jgi:hypothetical protein
MLNPGDRVRLNPDVRNYAWDGLEPGMQGNVVRLHTHWDNGDSYVVDWDGVGRRSVYERQVTAVVPAREIAGFQVGERVTLRRSSGTSYDEDDGIEGFVDESAASWDGCRMMTRAVPVRWDDGSSSVYWREDLRTMCPRKAS